MNKNDFLNIPEEDIIVVDVPTIGKVNLKAWSGKTRDDYNTTFKDKQVLKFEWIVASSMCDEKGNLLFDCKSISDLELISKKPSKVVMFLCDKILGHNILTAEAEEKFEKN